MNKINTALVKVETTKVEVRRVEGSNSVEKKKSTVKSSEAIEELKVWTTLVGHVLDEMV